MCSETERRCPNPSSWFGAREAEQTQKRRDGYSTAFLLTMKQKKANPSQCLQCGKTVTADQPGSVRWEGSDVVYCDHACWDARRDEQEKLRLWITAVHEAGHCLGARLAKSEITEATIIPKGSGMRASEGHIRSTTIAWEDAITEFLLGHAAEVEFGYPYGIGHGSDYERAEKELKDMLKRPKRQVWNRANGYKEEDRTPILGARWEFRTNAMWQDWKKTTRLTNAEWKPEFDKRVRRARRLAKKYRAWIEQVAKLLMEKRTLTNEQIPQLEAQ